MPPYTLPDNKTQSGIKSRSSKNGTAENYNEIRFEDKKGSEEILVHAERDVTVEVERNRTTTIGMKGAMVAGDDTLTVQNNLTETINNKQQTTATTSIEIICGQSKIRLDPTSITISSVNIKIDAQVQLEESAVMTQISGSATTKITGGLVTIN
jgi:type VI secretion system secreted protein VgrG